MARTTKTAKPATSSAPAAPTFTLRKPQEGLLKLLQSNVPNVLAAGSSRVGKSWLYMIFILLLCEEYPGSRHGVFRRNRNACERNLFKLTLFQAMNALGLSGYLAKSIDKSALSVTFPNGSVISFGGLDEHNRDRELGSEYQSIWMNEVSEFEYQDVEFLRGRLYGEIPHKTTGVPLKHRMLFDCNPDTFDDWDYKLFVLGIHPLTKARLQHPEDYAYHQMITDDQEYIRRNADQSPEWKERFIYANWQSSNPNALFPKKHINDNRFYGDLSELRFKHVVVGVDPAVTAHENSDYTGIVVAGITFEGHAYVLADRSVRKHDWEQDVLQAYDDFEADEIVAERNNGGDLVKKVIYQARNNVSVTPVWASRSKQMRAKPIADKYREGRVHHVGGDMTELETQMCAFDPEKKDRSPDRLDALVWSIWRLFEIGNTSGPVTYTSVPQQGYYR